MFDAPYDFYTTKNKVDLNLCCVSGGYAIMLELGGGTNSCICLNIGDTFGPQVYFGVVLYSKNEIIKK